MVAVAAEHEAPRSRKPLNIYRRSQSAHYRGPGCFKTTKRPNDAISDSTSELLGREDILSVEILEYTLAIGICAGGTLRPLRRAKAFATF